MKKIFKESLDIIGKQEVYCKSNEFLSVINQNDEIKAYFINDDSMERPNRFSIKMVGTGHLLDYNISDYTFLGTVQIRQGHSHLHELVFHVFYKKVNYLRGE